MCLEVLEGVESLGGFKVDFWPEDRNPWSETAPIIINKNTNSIGFTLQNGPIKEVGVNGCQVDTLIEAAKAIIEGLNKKFPSRENSVAITKLDEAIMWLEKRTKDRVRRDVEGKSEL